MIEIDCNDSIWQEGYNFSNNGFVIENQLTYVFQTKSTKITEDDREQSLGDTR